MTQEEAIQKLYVLTDRQMQVLQLRARGLETSGIAATLGLGSKTVEHHMQLAREALECNTSRACWLIGRAGLE